MNTQSSTHGHWPVFTEVLCATLTDRERLGLPDYYIRGRLDLDIASAFTEEMTKSQLDWLCTLQSPNASLAKRIACGQLLALYGDPRISVFRPEMIDIPGGEVMIGLSTEKIDEVMQDFEGLGLNRIWIEKECPRHSVFLNAFKMAAYPVTNAEYQVFLLDTKFHEIPSSWDFRRFPIERSNHPVYTVSAEAADAYVSWLSAQTGRPFRLPTEAEWEWAASGPVNSEFPWGQEFCADRANTAESGVFNSTAVGVFQQGRSFFGLSDMAGNVEEYVSDSYQPYEGGHAISDHLVAIHGQYRVARGGSFARFRDLARNKRRHGHNPQSPTYAMGFRLAQSI